MLMWLVEHVPTWLVWFILALGTIGIIASYFSSKLPFVGTYASAIRFGSVLVLVVGVWTAGAVFVSEGWRVRLAEAEIKTAHIKAESEIANARQEARIAELEQQVKEKQRVRTEYITKYITKYDNRCDVPNAVVGVLSSAAQNGIPPSPSSTDGDSSDVKLSDIVQNTSDNYATCYQIRDKVIEWQRWYTEQKAIYDKRR